MLNKFWSAAAFAVLLSPASFIISNALPLAPIPQVTGTSGIALVADCGPGFRNENGRCRLGAPVDVAPPVVPVACGQGGTHWDPRLRRCVVR
jgi:hypothetical protein